MAKKYSVHGKRKGSGKVVFALFLVVLGMFAAEQGWIYCFDGVDVQPMPDYIAAATEDRETGQTAVYAAQPTIPPTEGAELPVVTAEPRGNALTEVRPPVQAGFLPVCNGKVTDEKMVALTIDDCYQADNLREIIQMISDYGGRATLFPIGDNVAFLGGLLRHAVQRGFEIENHTMSHAGLYTESDSELAAEIWNQNRAVSEVLGVDYQMHFLRPRGGDNRYDQRTHAYMRQMGYYGIAYWAQVGSDCTADEIMQNLQPGDILLFHTTDRDLATLRTLIPRLYAAGYRMVTLNEMYNLPENEQRPLTDAEMPSLQPYARFDQTLRRWDYLHDVLLMQKRLDELGYLKGDYNGYFGKTTEKAVKAFQKDYGLEPDGLCGPATWQALFE